MTSAAVANPVLARQNPRLFHQPAAGFGSVAPSMRRWIACQTLRGGVISATEFAIGVNRASHSATEARSAGLSFSCDSKRRRARSGMVPRTYSAASCCRMSGSV